MKLIMEFIIGMVRDLMTTKYNEIEIANIFLMRSGTGWGRLK